MVRQLGVAGVLAALALSTVSLFGARSADAVIHEIVAAYCSGGDVGAITADGELQPPGLLPGAQAFARPVVASGAVDLGTLTVTDKANVKFDEGSSVFALDSSNVNHPSAAHCVKNALP